MKRKPSAPRNPYVAVARMKKAGAHRKSNKALRRAENMKVRECSSDGSSNRLLPGRSQVRGLSLPPSAKSIDTNDSVFMDVFQINSPIAQFGRAFAC